MGISCGVVGYGPENPFLWEYRFFLCFKPNETDLDVRPPVIVHNRKQLSAMQQLILKGKVMEGFNIAMFDSPLMSAMGVPLEHPDCQDIMLAIKSAKQKLPAVEMLDTTPEGEEIVERFKLQIIAVHTLGETKLGEGEHAVQMVREGRLDDLEAYCLQDVRLSGLVRYWVSLYGFVVTNYRLIPCSVPGGVAPWEWPGKWQEKFGAAKRNRPASIKQIDKLRHISGGFWEPALHLSMVEASALIDATQDWRLREEQAEKKKKGVLA